MAASLLRGHWYKRYYPLCGIRFTAGRNFRVDGRLTVRGPGRVVFGDNVRIGMHVTPWTHAPEAIISVGDRTFLNGTRMGCRQEITIGEDSIVAEAHLMDTDFHSTRKDRHSADAPVRVAPVRLGRNVWIAAAAGVLPGTSIGENSVVGFGAVCAGEYPSDSLIAGNPARTIKPIPALPETGAP